MNTLILINALINKEETFKSFEEYFNDGNNYFVYSFEESLPDFQNFNFRNFKMANLIKMENIKIISDSKYLKINSKNFESGKFVFEKFSDEIMPAFYGYMIDNTVVVALLSLLGTLIGSFTGIITANKLTNYRLSQLEKKVDKHNHVIERMYELEKHEEITEEQIKSIGKRVERMEEHLEN